MYNGLDGLFGNPLALRPNMFGAIGGPMMLEGRGTSSSRGLLFQVKRYQQLYQLVGRAHNNDVLETPVKLKITLPNFEQVVDQLSTEEAARGERLATWFNHGSVSGYSDLREHNSEREILAENFQIEPELLREVEKIWGQHFYPQQDLVGTYLIGLGDTTEDRRLVVNGQFKADANEGSWVAFYPDVPHEVKTVSKGHCAVLALKIFHKDSNDATSSSLGGEFNLPPALHTASTELITSLELPFGLILDRKYCMGTTELSGVDATLYSIAKNTPDTITPMIVPVMIHTATFEPWGDDDVKAQTVTKVQPFTAANAIIDAVKNLKDIPFYDFHGPEGTQSVEWSSKSEDVNYKGKEAGAEDRDIVYLSYALFCLPSSSNLEALLPDFPA
ncbi:hypothetical protein D9758_005091 [Tetrapyrgos nigripes]|uniref:Uncharacterized protein n=1 Tax=Tetrapyrgos nigripes TaxID=182062 RepID=A0A8H5GVS9_9AGAR|nr:hypothetical protein D9758_005091 [Tetrapyrgos nigripes]